MVQCLLIQCVKQLHRTQLLQVMTTDCIMARTEEKIRTEFQKLQSKQMSGFSTAERQSDQHCVPESQRAHRQLQTGALVKRVCKEPLDPYLSSPTQHHHVFPTQEGNQTFTLYGS